jgi:hypothetical protein
MKQKKYWYARSEWIIYMGPYKSELEAWKATIGLDGLPAKDAAVWCTDKKLK